MKGFRLSNSTLLYSALTLIMALTASRCGEATSKSAEKTGSEEPFVSDGLKLGQHADSSVADVTISTGAETGAASTLPVGFPLAVRPGARYLEDAAGEPFLIYGEAAWSLIAQLRREDVDLYLDDRRARGFNTLLISLIEHRFSTNAPANAYGQPPFLRAGDYSTPNEKYFEHADWILRRSAENGFLVLLVPSYMGFAGGSEGWYQEMAANGPAKLRQYGRYLGERYRHLSNIIWVHGADYNPPDKDLVRAIVDGIREFDPRALHSAQCAPETSAAAYWENEPWLDVNTIYTYTPVFSAALQEYARTNRMPFFLVESAYESEHGTTGQRLRTQAYHAVLSGAGGQIFGNNPIWHFDGPGLYPARTTWQKALGSEGTQSMTHLRSLFAAVPWWQLEPDVNNAFLIGGLGTGQDRAVAARAADRSFAIVYVPNVRSITLELDQLVGPLVSVRWYDPTNGEFSIVNESPFPAVGSHRFTPVFRNASGSGDWVLVLESRS
jgi:hypothetical protein